MADIPLRTYVGQIDGLVDKKQIDEAIAHCKHILTYYPKHLGTYQALGKALLEKGRHADAADIFSRVLSAMPDDYVSHIGMSIVCEDKGNIEGALQHMERAFEVMPSNSAIQEELRRLYGRRDGLMPTRTRLTRAALARMYVKGGLFTQAEAELKKALADDPDRLDLATVLAQVYWQTNRRQEAADICAGLVEKLPYNQEANRMLADILLTQGRTAELVPFRQRLEALDPYAAFAEPNTDGHGLEPKAETILIQKLNYTADMAANASGTPDWVTSIGATLEQPGRAQARPDWLPETGSTETDMTPASELPDWLQGAQGAVGGAPGQTLAEGSTIPSAAGDMPDWMKTTVTTPLDVPDWMKVPSAEEETPAAPTAEENTDWAAATVTTGEIPDWMKDMVPASPSAAPTDESSAIALAAAETVEIGEMPDWLKTTQAAPAEEVPDWLQQATSAPKTEVIAEPAAAASTTEEVPDWLKTTQATPVEELPPWMQSPVAESAPAAEAVPAADIGSMSEDDALRWLEGLALQQGAKPEEMVSQPPTAPTAAAAPEAEELPDWLKATEAAPAEESPAWMQGQPPAPGVSALADVGASTPPAEAEFPDWLNATEAATPAEELPDWLKVQAPTPLEEEAAPLAAAELPDWLPALAVAAPVEAVSAPAEAAPVPAEAEKPDWLKQMEAEADTYEATLSPATAQVAAAMPTAEAAPAAAEAEKPDWLKQMEAEADTYEATLSPTTAQAAAAMPTAEAAPAAAEAEKPDWLKQMEAEADTYDASLAPAAAQVAPAKATLRPDELPDFLQIASVEAVERADQPTHLADELEQEQAADSEEPPLAAAEIPDWLKAFSPAATEPETTLQPTETIQWLENTPALPTVVPAEPAASTAPAEPLPDMPEWVQRPVEETQAGQLADLPSWVQEPPPGPSDTVNLWLAKKKIPDWLRTPTDETADEPPVDWLRAPVEEASTGQAPEPPAAPSAPPTPPKGMEELSTKFLGPSGVSAEEMPAEAIPTDTEPPAAPMEVSEEDALRWLENLAEQQGAEQEGLITQSEEHLAQPPAWLAADETQAAPAAEEQPAPEMTAALPQPPVETPRRPRLIEEQVTKPLDQLPSWLTLDISDTGPTAPAVAAAPAPAEPAAMTEDDALRWLENLAAQQGVPSEELITKPEERLAQPPAWVAAETQAAEMAPVETPAPPETKKPAPPKAGEEFVTRPLSQLPGWLTVETPEPAAAEVPAAPTEPVAETPIPPAPAPAPAAPAEPAAMSEDEALRWLESLAVNQGARPEELITKPEERLAQPPAWVTAETQAVAEAESQAAATPAETFAAPEVLAAPVIEVPVAAEAAESAAAMSDDEALRWLESLAVNQGARPEELITKPEERLAQPPAWVTAETQAVAEAESQAVAAPAETLAAPEVLAAPVIEVPVAAEAAEPAAAMSDDEALRWLESLAVNQGARAEELVTKPEERLAQPPAWVTAETQAAQAETQPAPVEPSVATAQPSEPVLPTIAVARVQPEPELEQPRTTPAEAESAKDTRLAKLAEKLSAGRRAKVTEIEARFAAKRAEQEAARRAVQQKMERKSAAAEAEEVAPPAAPTQVPAAQVETPVVAVAPATAPAQPKPKPAAPKLKKIKLGKSPYAKEAPETVLTLARQRLAEGDADQAAEPLAYLVASNQLLQNAISELETYTARERSAPLLQILGDAYMKTNQLQKALDIYRQALGQL